MSDAQPFTEAQKQFLAGFTMGSDVSRSVRGLPVLSGSASTNSTNVKIGGDSAEIDGQPVPSGPDRMAFEAQNAVIRAGGKLVPLEQAKRDKNPLDMWDEIIARSDAGKFPQGNDVFLHKFHGMFYVAPRQNAYMMRLRIPGGLMHAWQLTQLADLAQRAAGGYIDLTTRANLQLREIPADKARDVLYGVRELDLVSIGSGGDNIRNCTASCLSGIDPSEWIETIPLAKRMHHYILNHREMYGLPRKFNIAFDGGGRIASLDDTNDIGFRAVRIADEQADPSSDALTSGVYFQLTLGGITGHKDFARGTDCVLTSDEAIEVAGAIVRVFVQHGDRTDRNKARLKYLLDRWGLDKFLAAVETQLGKPLRRIAADRIVASDNEDRHAHVGVHPQKQPGRSYIGVVFPVGRMTSEQARQLSAIAADLGNGELRLTVWQNLIIPHIRNCDLEQAQQRIAACGLDYNANAFRAGLVACTGSQGCKFAAAPTKSDGLALAQYLESRFTLDTPINIHLTGCHHSCAQHYIGDIGLQACQVEAGEEMVDGYHIFLGGGWGSRQSIARPVFSSVAFSDVPALIAALIDTYLQSRCDRESFASFVNRHSIDQLKHSVDPSLTTS